MCDILFRGQTRKYGEKRRMGDGKKLPGHWVYGGVLQGIGDHSIIYGGESENDPSEGFGKWCVHTETLGQFTGLTDKNGKKIFEGDILSEHGRLFIVVYDAKWARFKLQYIGRGIQYPEWNRGVQMEIVGNIHDNPELMEE